MGYPTAASVASDDIETAKAVQKCLRLKINSDYIQILI